MAVLQVDEGFAHAQGESPAYDVLLACSRCATCLPACPSYSATMLETHSPRGRVQLVRALEEGRLVPSRRLTAALDACLDCRACETVCPNGILPGQISTAARAALQRMTLARRLRRFVLGPLLSHAGWQEAGARVMRLVYQTSGLQRLIRASRVLRVVPALHRAERYLPPIPARSVRATRPVVVPAVGETRGRVGFFLGCAMNVLFADTTRKSIDVLARLGFEVVIPRDVVCCGAPQMASGERDIAHSMARRNLRLFDGLDAVITDCAACGAELKHYDSMLGDPSVRAFCERVRDFAEFVEPYVSSGVVAGSVTYHAPCHLAHAQGVCRSPKALLKRIAPDFRDLAEHDRCCGSAGMFWAQQPAIADNALGRKLAAIRAAGADTVATANPGCILQLEAGKGPEDRWKVRHISELVHEALGETIHDC